MCGIAGTLHCDPTRRAEAKVLERAARPKGAAEYVALHEACLG
jgi:hypothetical protein